MRVIVQVVSSAAVEIKEPQYRREIAGGMMLLVGFTPGDDPELARKVARKVAKLRIFPDEDGKINRDIFAVGGAVLSISQFTLYANLKKGNRPAFTASLEPGLASELYDIFNAELAALGLVVKTGQFGAEMAVSLCNMGPTTIIVDSEQL